MFSQEQLSQSMQTVAIQFPPFILAVIFHEWAHGRVAAWWGDTTARDQGRLTLNPLPHVDPIGTVLFPLINMFTGIPILIGWARPVPIDPKRFRKFRPGLFWVSLAGPMMNFTLATISAFIAYGVAIFVPQDFYLYEPLKIMAVASISLNFALGVFNLLPLPPLDGSKIIESFLSYNLMREYEKIARFSTLILLGLMFTGAINVLGVPIRFLTNATLSGVGAVYGLLGY